MKRIMCLLLAAMMILSLGITAFAVEKIGKIEIPEKIEKLSAPKEQAALQSTASAQNDETWYFDLIVNFNDEDKNYFTHDGCWQTGTDYNIALVFDEAVDYDDVWAYIDGDVVWDCDIYELPEDEPWEKVEGASVFVATVYIDANRTSEYKIGGIRFGLGDEEGCTIRFANDVPIVDPDIVKEYASEFNPPTLNIGEEGISSYYYLVKGEKYPMYGAYAITTDTFAAIEGKALNLAFGRGDYFLGFGWIKEGQQGINFYSVSYPVYENSSTLETLKNPYYKLQFFDKTPILCDYEITWDSDVTYGDLRENLNQQDEEFVYYYFYNNFNELLKKIAVDYSRVDAEMNVIFQFGGTNSSLGYYQLSANGSDIIEEGVAYDDGTEENKSFWKVDRNGTLTIHGKGTVWDYGRWISGIDVTPKISASPWWEYYEIINKVVVEEGITEFWSRFTGFENISKFSIPSTITELGYGLFNDMNVKTLGPAGGGYDIEYAWKETIPAYAFMGNSNIESAVIHENITKIGSCAFNPCGGLESVYFYGDIPDFEVSWEDEAPFEREKVTLYYIEGKYGWQNPNARGYHSAIFDPYEDDYVLGDVNGDEKINVVDANLIRRYAAELMELDSVQLLAADVNGDGKINVVDANLVRRFAAELIDKFPA